MTVTFNPWKPEMKKKTVDATAAKKFYETAKVKSGSLEALRLTAQQFKIKQSEVIRCLC